MKIKHNGNWRDVQTLWIKTDVQVGITNTQVIRSNQNFTIPSNIISLTVKVYGGGGGGAGITTAVKSGGINYPGTGSDEGLGESRIFGLVASGGQGGGIPAINQGGSPGGYQDEFGWENLGATVFGRNGFSPDQLTQSIGGLGGNFNISGGNGGNNTTINNTGILTHYFDNTTDQHITIDGSGADFVPENKTSPDGVLCSGYFNSSGKYYTVNWKPNTYFPNNDYEVIVENISNYTAGGLYDDNIGICSMANITTESIDVQFRRQFSYLTYVRSFSIKATWVGQGNIGGGGGGYIEATMTRQQLINSVVYSPGTTHEIQCGTAGTGGGKNLIGVNPGKDGVPGFVELVLTTSAPPIVPRWKQVQSQYIKHNGQWKQV